MKWTGLNEIREKYLAFFETKEHLRLPSFSLVPQNDNSILLINAGMTPMKKYFTGEITPPRKRVTTCQKCIRTPDIENVGKTARHGTYFEMLGNFSFGDYFKTEAITWAWEFFTKVMELPEERLSVTIYQDDDEAFEIWNKVIGLPEEKIIRMGKEDNFWEHGTGPCGPCSEIHFDRGEEYGCGKPDCKVGCDCDRYMEVWNLVFTQFDRQADGTYERLANPNIDTGMGLERLACVMQGVNNLFEVDTVRNIMKHISSIANVEYGSDANKDISLRVITDHIRSTTMMISDGVMPSNEGRGYVLRRLLRRAARHGKLLGIDKPFLSEVCDTVIKENLSGYPELSEKRDFIKNVISKEEEAFDRTVDQGLKLLNEMIENTEGSVLSGEDAFKLNDTFGFPIDLTVELLSEKNMTVDRAAYDELMQEQKKRARDARKKGTDAWEGEASPVKGLAATKFVGYETLDNKTKIIAIVKDNALCDELLEGEEGTVILEATPFYGESGGQVGDIGKISSDNGIFDVDGTTKNHDNIFLHSGTVTQGAIKTGDGVSAKVDNSRYDIRRNHTVAHILQAGLRKILGTHVEQAGQLVDSERMRFDFTHFQALSADELNKVESFVNSVIFAAIDVITRELPIDEAKKLGAMALFGEKYGDIVRVVSIEDYSVELCGGTHVTNTAQIGLFKILSESSVAAGVRRIEAVTGENVLKLINRQQTAINTVAETIKAANADDIVRRASQITDELKKSQQTVEKLNAKLAGSAADELLNKAEAVGEIKVIIEKIEGMTPDAARELNDSIRSKSTDCAVLLALINGDKLNFASACGEKAVKAGLNAGLMAKTAAVITGGNGGGRPDSAMAGGKDKAKIDEALAAVKALIKEKL